MKMCSLCLVVKGIENFYMRNGRARPWCKPCWSFVSLNNQRKQRAADPERISAMRSAQCAKNPGPIIDSTNCLQCGTEVYLRKPSHIGRKRFCSRSCAARWHGYRNCRTVNAMQAASRTPEVKAKRLAAIVSGPDHPMWIDGRAALTQRPKAINAAWRSAVFTRDNFTCQACGVRGGCLQADHVKPYALYPEHRWDVSNGRTLCVPCHKATPTYAGKMAKQLRLQREPRL